MAYIGPKPSQTLATPTSQYFNGTGSQTVFTLNRAVNVPEDLEVFVNNIQQEPGVGKSYTAIGTTLTFDVAPSSGTANVYVVYRGLAEVTTRLEHDPNAALAATTGTFSGNVDVTGTVTADGLTVDGNSEFNGLFEINNTSVRVDLMETDAVDLNGRIQNTGGTLRLNTLVDDKTSQKIRMSVDHATGDISFYEDTGTSAKFFWDASAESLGIGTDSPAAPIHLKTSSSAELRLEQDGAGYGSIKSSDFGILYLDADAGNTVASSSMRFRVDGSEAMRISSGDIHFGVTSLVTTGSTGVSIDTSLGLLKLGRSGTSTATMTQFFNSNGVVGNIQTSGTSTSYLTSSDYRLKENVVADWDATTRLKQLNPVRFNFIADPDTTVDGFLAHEVQDVVPEAISGTHNEVDDEGNPVYQGIDQSKLTPLLVKTIQELEARITALEAN